MVDDLWPSSHVLDVRRTSSMRHCASSIVVTLGSIGILMWHEGLPFEAIINIGAFMTVAIPTIMWMFALSRVVPVGRMLQVVWRLPLWLGIAAAILGVTTVLARLGAGGTEELGRGIAVAIVALLYGVILGPCILLPLSVCYQNKGPEVIASPSELNRTRIVLFVLLAFIVGAVAPMGLVMLFSGTSYISAGQIAPQHLAAAIDRLSDRGLEVGRDYVIADNQITVLAESGKLDEVARVLAEIDSSTAARTDTSRVTR